MTMARGRQLGEELSDRYADRDQREEEARKLEAAAARIEPRNALKHEHREEGIALMQRRAAGRVEPPEDFLRRQLRQLGEGLHADSL